MMNDHQNGATLAPGEHVEPEELMACVLEMLPAGQRETVEAHLFAASSCAACQQELASIRNDLGLFGGASVELVGLNDPPAHSRDRLMAEVASTQQSVSRMAQSEPVPVSETVSAPSTRVAAPALQAIDGGNLNAAKDARRGAQSPRIPSWVGWAVAAGVAIAATHFYQEREALRSTLATQAGQIAQLSADQARARGVVDALTDRGAQRVTLTLTKAPAPVQPTGRATYLANKGTLIFLASHMAPLPAGKTYELWVIPASGAAPVPAGTFRPDEGGNASVVTARLQRAGVAKAFGVTIEPTGGSTTPTMPILLAGS